MLTPSEHTKMAQESVGPCPICGVLPHWFNNIPLMAYCYGSEGNEHPEATRIITGKAQPYGKITRSVWKISKELV
jgi:hypothetical protein